MSKTKSSFSNEMGEPPSWCRRPCPVFVKPEERPLSPRCARTVLVVDARLVAIVRYCLLFLKPLWPTMSCSRTCSIKVMMIFERVYYEYCTYMHHQLQCLYMSDRVCKLVRLCEIGTEFANSYDFAKSRWSNRVCEIKRFCKIVVT